MTAEIKTIIGQLSIAGGASRSDAPNQVAVREPKAGNAPGAGKGDLFVLTEVRGPVSNRDNVERQLAEAIRDAYYLARGSITASLRRALQAGSDQLYRHNQQVNKNERIVAGIAAVVVRGHDVFATQIGPAALFAVINGYIRRYPDKSAWLDEALPPDLEKLPPALGVNNLVEPNMHHLRLNANDTLVLADSRFAGQLPLDTMLRSVTPRQAKATVKALGQTGRTRNGSAMVLAAIETDRPTLETLKEKARLFDRRRSQPATPPARPMPVLEAVAEALPPPAAVSAKGQPTSSRFFARAEAAAASQPRPKPKPAPPVKTPPPMRVEKEDDEEERYFKRQSASGPASRAGANRIQSDPILGKILRGLGAGLLVLVALLGSGLRNLLTLVLPQAGGDAPRQAARMYITSRHQPCRGNCCATLPLPFRC